MLPRLPLGRSPPGSRSLARPAPQKSVVLLSHLPFLDLFAPIMRTLGPLFHDHGVTVLEAAVAAMAHWPAPVAGARVSLPLLGSVTAARLPSTAATPPGHAWNNLPSAHLPGRTHRQPRGMSPAGHAMPTGVRVRSAPTSPARQTWRHSPRALSPTGAAGLAIPW